MVDAPSPHEPPNPYAAPQTSDFGPDLGDDSFIDATTGQRFLTFIIDYLGVMFLAFVIGMASVVGGFGDALTEVPDFLFGTVIMTLYYVGLEASTGRTLGKLVAGTRVINEQGGTASVMQVVGRSLIRIVPFEAFSAFGGGQMWHDRWSSTRVITTRM